jgi:hypothetical protein
MRNTPLTGCRALLPQARAWYVALNQGLEGVHVKCCGELLAIGCGGFISANPYGWRPASTDSKFLVATDAQGMEKS